MMTIRKILRKTGLLTAAGLIFLLFSRVPAAAEGEQTPEAPDDLYHLVDFATGEEKDVYTSWWTADSMFRQLADSADNLGITYNGKVMKTEYGILSFRVAQSCSVDVAFTYVTAGTQGFTNGCDAADAAYLGTDANGQNVEFLQAGAKGRTSIDNVTIIPVQNLSTRLSAYTVTSGRLYHEIKTDMGTDNYAAVIDHGPAPSGLSEGSTYYSYDGHYFYPEDQLDIMLNDYLWDTRANSLNPEEPYYDYYQFVPHRTLTAVSPAEFALYLQDTAGIHGAMNSYRDDDKDGVDDNLSRSQLYGVTDAFWQYQYEYGANAMMMLAVSMQESAAGRNALCYARNNLFSHAAYDTDEEAQAGRFTRRENSVYAHAKYYISGTYCSPMKPQFHGSYFGNLAAGMNVSYSSDPYWGEKMAAAYRHLDEAFGSPDYGRCRLAVNNGVDRVAVYARPSLYSDVLYRMDPEADQVFIILDEQEENGMLWYQIQSEATLNEQGSVDLVYAYDFDRDRAWIRADAVTMISAGTGTDQEMTAVRFDGQGGMFPGSAQTSAYSLPAGAVPAAAVPVKEKALFSGWTPEVTAAGTEAEYQAVYRDVDHIEITQLPRQEYASGERIDLSGGTLTVYFSDDESTDTELTTDMISGFDLSAAGTQTVRVNYAGCETDYEIRVSDESAAVQDSVRREVLRLIDSYGESETLSEKETADILAVKEMIDAARLPYLTQSQMRILDNVMRSAIGDRIRYSIDNNVYDVQVSGLTAAVPLGDSLNRRKYLEDTYRVQMLKGVSERAGEALNAQAAYLQNDVRDQFEFGVRRNYELFELTNPVVVSIAKPADAREGEVFTVLYYDRDRDEVVRCYTRQTANTVSFMTRGNGEYMLISRLTPNLYVSEDPVEVLNVATQSRDFEKYRVYISVGSILLVILAVLGYRYWKQRNERRVAAERIIKTEELENGPDPLIEFTQALELYETKILRIDDYREENHDQHDRRDQ